jgi:hypothetical protein
MLDELVIRYLGHGYIGRNYLRFGELKSIGVVRDRITLETWMDHGAFPRGIRIAGPYGRTLVWLVPEVVAALAARAAERETVPRGSVDPAPALLKIEDD